jgi:hypothetical protein
LNDRLALARTGRPIASAMTSMPIGGLSFRQTPATIPGCSASGISHPGSVELSVRPQNVPPSSLPSSSFGSTGSGSRNRQSSGSTFVGVPLTDTRRL